MDPRVRRAHYYLGTSAMLEEGVVRLDEAITEFRKELQIAPDDALATLRLGVVLVEARRDEEALPLLEKAVRGPRRRTTPGCIWADASSRTGVPPTAVASLQRALEMATRAGDAPGRREAPVFHYQLATAFRATGATARPSANSRKRSGCPSNSRKPSATSSRSTWRTRGYTGCDGAACRLDRPAFEALTAAERAALAGASRRTLARIYLNLGIMHAQAARFARAAESFELAAGIDPALPAVQYSLGVAYFNAEQYEKALPALARAPEQQPGNADVAGCSRWRPSTRATTHGRRAAARGSELPVGSLSAVRVRARAGPQRSGG